MEPTSIRAMIDGEAVPVSAPTLLGSLLGALPDAEVERYEMRGYGLAAIVRYGDGRFRVQIDPLGDSR